MVVVFFSFFSFGLISEIDKLCYITIQITKGLVCAALVGDLLWMVDIVCFEIGWLMNFVRIYF